MDRHDAAATDRWPDSEERRRRPRRWRLVPPAVTPVRASDVAAGIRGQWAGRGRRQFREEIAGFLDAERTATYTSYRRTLAGCFHELAAADDDGRDTVLIPAFCSADFPEAIEGVGLEPRRYDIDPETLAFDPDSLREGLEADPLAVVSIPVLGYGSPMDELVERCGDPYLVEVLGYALGTEYDGRRLGTFGDCAVLNFQQGKPIPVGGGMVVADNDELSFGDAGRDPVGPNVAAVAGYAALGRPRPYYAYAAVRDAFDGVGDRATTHPDSTFDVAYDPPFDTISDFQGTVASRVFGRLGDHRRARERTATHYREQLSSCPRVSAVEAVPGLSNCQHVRYPLVAETTALRDRIKTALADAGIGATPLYDWPVLDPEAFPGAASLQRRILTLPTHPYVDDRDRRLIVETVRETAAGGR
jgi:dTDP-4-amino-4,6-dideoxygalactose transaminase